MGRPGIGIEAGHRILVLVEISQVDVNVDVKVSDRGEVGDVEVGFHVDLDLDVQLKVIRRVGAARFAFAALAGRHAIRAGILVARLGARPPGPGTLLDRCT